MIFSGSWKIAGATLLRFYLTLLLTITVSITTASTTAGQTPTLDYSGRSADKRPELLEQRPAESESPVTLPPPIVRPPEASGTSVVNDVFVLRIDVLGSTVFTPVEIRKITSSYENRTVTIEDLETLRRELTLLYINNGYINSGVVLPDQAVTDGVIKMQVVEGKLAAINVEGNQKFIDSYLVDRISLGAEIPLNLGPLQDSLQLLQQDNRIKRIQAQLRPGAKPGEADLNVLVEEAPPVSLWLAFNNYQSPSIGEERGIATFEHQNLTGRGDIFSFTYGVSEGLKHLIDAWYLIPLNSHDTTIQFRYRQDEQNVIDDIFDSLDIVSKEKSFEITLRHPIYRSLTQDFAVDLSIGKEKNENELLGDSFSFSPGEEDGEAKVAPLRFGLEWTYRTQKQVIAARSRITFGIDAFGATIHDNSDIPDGRFVAWLGQLQYARILDTWGIQLLARADIQRSSDPLLPVEQMGIGGRYTVRGYRENQMVTDQAFVASLETRIPLVENMRWADYLHFCQFVDYGKGDNLGFADPSPPEISSVGLGVRWGASVTKLPFDLRADAEIYWGHQLRDVDDYDDDGLQDDGIHYQFALTGFF